MSDNLMVLQPLTKSGYFSRGIGISPEYRFVYQWYNNMETDQTEDFPAHLDPIHARVLFSNLRKAFKENRLLNQVDKRFKIVSTGSKHIVIRVA